MNAFWLIFHNEYCKKVARRRFLLSTLGVPLMVVLVMGISIFVAVDPGSSRALGVVDQAGIIDPSAKSTDDGTIIAFPDTASARQALREERIRAYYVLPRDYPQTGKLDLYYLKRPPNDTIRASFDHLLRGSLMRHVANGSNIRLVEAPTVMVRSLDGREISQGGFLNVILPFAASFGLIFAVMMTAGSLLQVVAEEKENRTIEILVTSLSPEQLMIGKAAGLMAVCLTQIGIWAAAIGLCLAVSKLFFEPLRQIAIPWPMLLLAGLFFLPTYALIAAIMTAIGGAAGEMRQSQQIGGLLNLLFLLPLFLATLILQSPDNPLVVFLTLFPTTAFATILLRWSLGSIPLWQMVTSWVLLATSSLAMIVLAARIFRLGMLCYGKGLRIKSILAEMKA